MPDILLAIPSNLPFCFEGEYYWPLRHSPPQPVRRFSLAIMRVALFVTCLVDLLRPSIGFAAISRLSLREMPAAEECCGFGGSFSIRFGDISAAIADRKCANVRQAGVDAVVGGELGCLLNIEGRLRRLGDRHTRVLHIAEVLTGDGRRS